MKNVDFLTIGDKNYFDCVLISAKQIARHHPESKLYIYDWGFTDIQKNQFKKLSNTEILPWELRMATRMPDMSRTETLKKLFGASLSWKEAVYTLFQKRSRFIHAQNFFDVYQSETFFFNKLLCIKAFVTTHENRFVFLDGDAFIIKNLSTDIPFDIGVTRRRQHELDYRYNRCQLLNSGVIFFFGSHEQRIVFTDAWFNEYLQTKELIAEQTSLSRMLLKHRKDFFEKAPSRHTVTIGDTSVCIAVFKCEEYNYNWIEEFDPNRNTDVYILHFKSGRFKTPLFKEITKTLEINHGNVV